ncbi:unnamed protein product [Symbiodinium necroappetens]|uniref:C3H1-type domain-containing protein n=1 Tax=Symbiodinium necroappetens TaxID=1628268 RepID=A0A812T5T5_9DINO|nr:unnamed protein product [Symbiodinium necroappetens]
MALTQIPFPAALLGKFEAGQVSSSFQAKHASPATSPASTGGTFSEAVADSPISLTGTKSAFFTANASEKFQLHKAGQCHPCVAFAYRAGGCYKGDSCTHCHCCTAAEASVRRRQLQEAARRQRKQQRDQGAIAARILAGESFWL